MTRDAKHHHQLKHKLKKNTNFSYSVKLSSLLALKIIFPMREKHNLLVMVLYLQRQPPTNMAVLLYRYYITGNFRNCQRIYLGPTMKRQKHINHSNIFTKFLKVYNKQSFFIYIICFIFQSIFRVDVKICYIK